MNLKPLVVCLTCLGIASPVLAQFDVTTHRMLISSKTISAMSSTDVNGSRGGTNTAVDMYYDTIDSHTGYPGTQNLWDKTWSTYLSGPLGLFGPLGSAGPLGSLGPLGVGSVTSLSGFGLPFTTIPSQLWDGSINFGTSPTGGAFSSTGPYGYLGPLGANGPITATALYDTMYHLNENLGCTDGVDWTCDYNDFTHQLDTAGVWGILGPGSVLGALGPLGPLGSTGWGTAIKAADATCVDTTGNYYLFTATSATAGTCSGTIARNLVVPFGSVGIVERKFDLVERYDRAALITQQGVPSSFTNDTSFSVKAGDVDSWTAANHTYYFRSAYDQFVSILPVPVNGLADFDAEVEIRRDSTGSFLTAGSASSAWSALASGHTFVLDSSVTQDFGVVRAKSNDIFKVTVTRNAPSVYHNYGYYLHVVGTGFSYRAGEGAWENTPLFQYRRTTAGVPTFNIVGPHQSDLGTF